MVLINRGRSRTAPTFKMERFVIIVNSEAVNYYRKRLHFGCCRSPRSVSDESGNLYVSDKFFCVGSL